MHAASLAVSIRTRRRNGDTLRTNGGWAGPDRLAADWWLSDLWLMKSIVDTTSIPRVAVLSGCMQYIRCIGIHLMTLLWFAA